MKRIIEHHRWFVRESYSYTGMPFWRYPVKWIKAYTKFMMASLWQ